MVEKEIEFDYHVADNAEEPHVSIFNVLEDGSQDQQLVEIPILAGTRSQSPKEDFQDELKRASHIGEFIANALNAYVQTPQGNTAYKKLLPSLYLLAKKYAHIHGTDPDYFEGMRVCPKGHTFHIDDADSLIPNGEPGERNCPVCHTLTV